MKKLTEAADRYLRDCTWKDISVLKFCLMALGVLMGLHTGPEEETRSLGGHAGVRRNIYSPHGQVPALSAGRAVLRRGRITGEKLL